MPNITQCRICKNVHLKKIFSLGDQPLANNLLNTPMDVKHYPLDLYQCDQCQLIQLGYVVPKEEMFDTYFYIPSVSKTNMDHFDRLSDLLINDLHLQPNNLVVDVGCSDVSLLKMFNKKGMRTAGVEPAKNLVEADRQKSQKPHTFDETLEQGYMIWNEYFSPSLAKQIVQSTGKRAKLVTMTNVFAHIDNLSEVVEGLDELLDEDGVFFAQFPDVRNLFEENQFDTVYHEHLSYFTYEPLYYLFSKTKFEIFKITSDKIHGGSMQIWVRRRKDRLALFQNNVEKIKEKLVTYLLEQKKQGKRIVGFAAAAKGTVLLNYCGLKNDIIDYVVDDIPWKQHKYIPGVNIPVVPSSFMEVNPPDVMLILAWNFKEEIIKKHKRDGLTMVVPIPEVEIIL